MSDVLDRLEADHRTVERMLKQLADTDPGAERDQLVDRLVPALELHMRFEETEIYPILQRVDGELAEEAGVEHGLARDGLTKIRELTAAPGFGAAVEMLTAGISHHVEEEENEVFPKLRKETDDALRERLASELGQMKSAAGLFGPDLEDASKFELADLAERAGIEGRSSMTKDELRAALRIR